MTLHTCSGEQVSLSTDCQMIGKAQRTVQRSRCLASQVVPPAPPHASDFCSLMSFALPTATLELCVLVACSDHAVGWSPQGRATTALPLPPNASICVSKPRQSFPLPAPVLITPAGDIDHSCSGAAEHSVADMAPAAVGGGGGGSGGAGLEPAEQGSRCTTRRW